VRMAAQGLSLGLQQAPGVAKALWPGGTTDSQIFQISALETEVAAAKDQIELIINSGLGLIMSDVPTFVDFASSGAFSGHESLSLPNVTEGLDFGLKTYMTSESLSQNGWFAVVMGNYTASEFANSPNCANVSGGTICSETGDKSHYDQSAALFWSMNTGRQYLLWKNKGNAYSYPILNAINGNGWADLGTLFDGAYSCTYDGTVESRRGMTMANFCVSHRKSRRANPQFLCKSDFGSELHLAITDLLYRYHKKSGCLPFESR